MFPLLLFFFVLFLAVVIFSFIKKVLSRNGYFIYLDDDVVRYLSLMKHRLSTNIYNDTVHFIIFSIRKNAFIFNKITEEFKSFSNYIWGFVDHKQQINYWPDHDAVPVSTPISDAISKDLKKRGMSFVGSTIIYAYMQAIGMVDDHIASCWCYHRNRP